MCAFVSEDKQRGLVHAGCVPFSSVISSDSVVVRTDDATRLKNLGIEPRLVLPRGSAGHNDCLFLSNGVFRLTWLNRQVVPYGRYSAQEELRVGALTRSLLPPLVNKDV